jgi:hypothetical protein
LRQSSGDAGAGFDHGLYFDAIGVAYWGPVSMVVISLLDLRISLIGEVSTGPKGNDVFEADGCCSC